MIRFLEEQLVVQGLVTRVIRVVFGSVCRSARTKIKFQPKAIELELKYIVWDFE